MRDAAGKIGGAVDRIDHPETITDRSAALLAEEGVVMKVLGDRLADMRLGGGIRLGQKVLRPLHREGARRAVFKATEHKRSGRQDNVSAKARPTLKIVRIEWSFQVHSGTTPLHTRASLHTRSMVTSLILDQLVRRMPCSPPTNGFEQCRRDAGDIGGCLRSS